MTTGASTAIIGLGVPILAHDHFREHRFESSFERRDERTIGKVFADVLLSQFVDQRKEGGAGRFPVQQPDTLKIDIRFLCQLQKGLHLLRGDLEAAISARLTMADVLFITQVSRLLRRIPAILLQRGANMEVGFGKIGSAADYQHDQRRTQHEKGQQVVDNLTV